MPPATTVSSVGVPPPSTLGPEKLFGWHSSTLAPLEKEAVYQVFQWMKSHQDIIMWNLKEDHILRRLMPLAENSTLDDAQVRGLLNLPGFQQAAGLAGRAINTSGLEAFLSSLLSPAAAPATAPPPRTPEDELRAHLGAWIASHKAILEKSPGPLPPLAELLRKAAQAYPSTESEEYKQAISEIINSKLVQTASGLREGSLNVAGLTKLLSESYEIMSRAGTSSVVRSVRSTPGFAPPSAATFSPPAAATAAVPTRSAVEIPEEVKKALQQGISAWVKAHATELIGSTTDMGRTLYQLSYNPSADVASIIEALKGQMDLKVTTYDPRSLDLSLRQMAGLSSPSGMMAAAPPPVGTPSSGESLSGRAVSPPSITGAPSLPPTESSLLPTRVPSSARRAGRAAASSLEPITEEVSSLQQARKDAAAWVEALKEDSIRNRGTKADAILRQWMSWPGLVLDDLFANRDLLEIADRHEGEYDKEVLMDYLDGLIEEPPAPDAISPTISPAERERNVLSAYLYDRLRDVAGVVKHMKKSTQPLNKLLEEAIVGPKRREALLNELLKNADVKAALAERYSGNALNQAFDRLFPLTEEQAKTILGEWILDHAPAHRTMSGSTVLDLIQGALSIDRKTSAGKDNWTKAVNSIWAEVRKHPNFEKGVSVGALTRYLKRLTPGT